MENPVDKLLEKFFKDIQFAADVYILHMCVCLFAVSPARVYKSKLQTRLRRSFFAISQRLFVVLFVLVIWLAPIVTESINLAKILQFVRNLAADPCYIDPGFLGSTASNVNGACETAKDVKQDYHTIGLRIELFLTTLQNFEICNADIYGRTVSKPIAELWEMAVAADVERLEPYDGLQCTLTPSEASANTTVFVGALLEDFVIAPGVVSIETDGELFLFTFSILLAISGKFILVNFGYRLTRAFDPLCFHNGEVEVLETQKLPKGINVHTVTQYKRAQNFVGLVLWSFFAMCFFIRTMINTIRFSPVFPVFVASSIVLWAVLHVIFYKHERVWCTILLTVSLMIGYTFPAMIYVVTDDFQAFIILLVLGGLSAVAVVLFMRRTQDIYCIPAFLDTPLVEFIWKLLLHVLIYLVLVALWLAVFLTMFFFSGFLESLHDVLWILLVVSLFGLCVVAHLCYVCGDFISRPQITTETSTIDAPEQRTLNTVFQKITGRMRRATCAVTCGKRVGTGNKAVSESENLL